MVLGSNFTVPNTINSSSAVTVLGTNGTNFTSTVVFDVEAAAGGGAAADISAAYGHGKGLGAGVIGVAGGGTGVEGGRNTINAGLAGFNDGTTAGGMGVYGEIPSTSSINGIAIYALNYSTYAGPGPGAGGFGIYGLSAKGHGLVGATAAAGGAAVVGASNSVAGAYAAAFYGPVVVSGSFVVVGGAKSAAVPHPDGSHRLLYCVESPESWFEDFGKARLECGRAVVPIDPDFAAVADLSDYHVFVTGYDTDHPLYIREQTAAGFTVEADTVIAGLKGRKEADLSGTFSWRVIAKRRDIQATRLAPVTIPQEPTLPSVPSLSAVGLISKDLRQG
jgi:hypothetical protein